MDGGQIAQTALSYAGHRYHYGGYEADPNGWDCSSFVNWVLGHDFGMILPLGIKHYNGGSHGPTTMAYLVWTGARRVSRKSVQAGDLCVWPTHMGIAINQFQMISAENPAKGTAVSKITGFAAEPFSCMRIKGVATEAGTNNVSLTSTSPSGGGTSFFQGILNSLFPGTGSALNVAEKLGSFLANPLDAAERIALVVFGAVIIFIGLFVFASIKSPRIHRKEDNATSDDLDLFSGSDEDEGVSGSDEDEGDELEAQRAKLELQERDINVQERAEQRLERKGLARGRK